MTQTHPNDEYDSPWKRLIELYFAAFMRFFFPAAHAQIDWQHSVQFLDKELERVVRDADSGRRYADILGEVRLLDGTNHWILIHIEVQGQVIADFDERMFIYNYRLFDWRSHDVASFAVLSDTDPTWRPGRYQRELLGSTQTFTYPTVKLHDYGAAWDALEADDNPFATVVMAHLKNQETKGDPTARYDWKFYLIRRLYQRGYSRQDVLHLFHFIDWVMRLPKDLEHQLREEIVQMEMREAKPYVSMIERFAQEKGEEAGRKVGEEVGRKVGEEVGRKVGEEVGRKAEAIRLLLRLLSYRFGPVSEAVQAHLHTLKIEQIEPLVDVALAQTTLDGFVEQLPPPAAPTATLI